MDSQQVSHQAGTGAAVGVSSMAGWPRPALPAQPVRPRGGIAPRTIAT